MRRLNDEEGFCLYALKGCLCFFVVALAFIGIGYFAWWFLPTKVSDITTPAVVISGMIALPSTVHEVHTKVLDWTEAQRLRRRRRELAEEEGG